jgi:hypothetical protein
MKDIKERVRDKNPKIRNPAARLPKELVRSAVLEAKEKPRELHEKSSGQSESPTQYGTEKIESVQYRAASVAGKSIGKTTYQGGKKLAGVTYRKIKERKSRQEEAKAAEEAMEQGAESGKKLIKLKPEQAALAKENGKRQVKAAPRVVKVSGLSQEKIKTQASMQKQQMFYNISGTFYMPLPAFCILYILLNHGTHRTLQHKKLSLLLLFSSL